MCLFHKTHFLVQRVTSSELHNLTLNWIKKRKTLKM